MESTPRPLVPPPLDRRRRRLTPLVLLLVLAVIAAGCGDSDGGGAAGDDSGGRAEISVPEADAGDLPPPEEDTGTIRVASLPIPHNVQFIELAQFADQYGLDVEWVSFQRYSDTQLAVSQGDVAFAAAGYHTIALDTAPTNVDIVAGGNAGAQALVIREGVEVEDWDDLAGLKLGVAPNSGPDVQFTLAAEEAGFDAESIERVNFTTIGPPTLVALRNGEIDGMLCWEITCAQAVADGQGYYAPIDIGENPTGNANTLMLANREWADAHPNATTLLVKAYVDAVEHFRDDPDEWVTAVTAATGSEDPEVLDTALESIDLEWELHRDRALATAAAYAELGISTRDMSSEVEEYLNYDYLERATGSTLEEVGG
jgi:ABC-type nitrate/sulfonate/bicarbonate transport system substrate-binding protein